MLGSCALGAAGVFSFGPAAARHPPFEDRIPDMPVVEGKHYAYTPAGRKKARAAAKRIGKKMKRGKRAGKKPRRLA